MSVACSVLAAGASRRLGQPKQLVQIHESSTLVRWAAECACRTRCSPVSVILGAHALDVREALMGLPIEIVSGFDWREGIAASIRTATHFAIERAASGLMLCVCDQPLLSTDHLNELWEASEGGERLAASYYANRPGVPAVFPARYFRVLMGLRGDAGAASFLRFAENVALVPWWEGQIDVDCPDQLPGRARW
jgi:molybdenum cofactor cytidylyltransferase